MSAADRIDTHLYDDGAGSGPWQFAGQVVAEVAEAVSAVVVSAVRLARLAGRIAVRIAQPEA